MDNGAKQAKTAAKRFEYPSPLVFGAVRFVAFLISKALWFVRFRGIENIPNDESGFVLVSNHPTYLDPVWISIPIKKKGLRYMAWDQAFEWPLVGKLIRYLGAFPVKTEASVTKTAIAESLRTLRGGGILVIFPEGEREFSDGEMLEFKSGAVHIAMNSAVPILPVSIRGGNRIWPRGQKIPNLFRRVEVTYHPTINPPERSDSPELDAHLEKVNDALIQTIASATRKN